MIYLQFATVLLSRYLPRGKQKRQIRKSRVNSFLTGALLALLLPIILSIAVFSTLVLAKPEERTEFPPSSHLIEGSSLSAQIMAEDFDDIYAKNSVLESHLGGCTKAVFLQGHYLFTNQGPELIILDVISPTQPIRVGSVTLPGIINDIQVLDGLAYVAATQAGLRIVDISDPTQPQEIGSFNYAPNVYSAYAMDVAVQEDVAYIAAKNSGLKIVDVSDPTQPVQISSYGAGGGTIMGVTLGKERVFLADFGANLVRVLDVSNLALPIQTGEFFAPGANDVVVRDDQAFIAAYDFWIADISDPDDPTEIGYLYMSVDSSPRLAITENVVYLASDALMAIDFTVPTNPVLFWINYFEDNMSKATSVAISGPHIYAASMYKGLTIYHDSQHGGPREIGRYISPTTLGKTKVVGNYAYVTDYYGLQIIDVRIPEEPQYINEVRISGGGVLDVVGNYAYSSNPDGHLRSIDVSDVNNIVVVGFMNLYNNATDIEVVEDFAYIVGSSGLVVIDVSDPADMIWRGGLSGSFFKGLALEDNDYAYIGDDTFLRIFDISAAPTMTETGAIQLDHAVQAIDIGGQYAYVGTDILNSPTGQLVIVDISNPASPKIEGRLDLTITFRNVDIESLQVEGNLVYLALWNGGLQIVDVSDPQNPRLTASNQTFYSMSNDVHVENGYAYVVNQLYEYGYFYPRLSVVDVSDTGTPVQDGNYDTPFYYTNGVAEHNGLLVVTENRGMTVIDASVPGTLSLLAEYPQFTSHVKAAFRDNYAFVSDSNGFRVLDFTDPLAITETNRVDLGVITMKPTIVGDRAYMPAEDAVHVFDITNPISPTEIITFTSDLLTEVRAVEVISNTAYVLGGYAELILFDISELEHPVEMGFYDSPDNRESSYGLVVENDMVYITLRYFSTGDGRVRIVDATDPFALVERNFIDIDDDIWWGIAISDNRLFLANGFNGLQVWNVSDPDNPWTIGYFDTGHFAFNLDLVGPTVYVGDTEAGVYAIRYQEPQPFQAAFEAAPVSGTAPLTVSFTNNSNGFYESCQWHFGDGESSNQCSNTTMHHYYSKGIYTVSLTVSDSSISHTLTKPAYITVTIAASDYKVYLPVICRAP